MKHRILVLLFVATCSITSTAQRITDKNVIGWVGSLNTIHFNKKVSLWLEYQWRREGVVTDWQQSLFRTGAQFHFKNGISAMAGYAYIVTYPYGDFPAGPYHIPEHRIFEQFVWNDNIGRVALNHRFRLEQRYLGKINQKAAERDVDGYNYLNRVRYQLRATVPLNKKKMEDKTWYAAAYDEIFIGFGKNVGQNIFDQNRIGAVIGYQYNKMLRLEAGYLNQIVQQGGLVNGREVFQYNNGVLLNVFFTKP